MTKRPAVPVGVLTVATVLALAGFSRAQEGHPLYACSGRVTGALRDYTVDFLHTAADCELDRLTGRGAAECATDEDTQRQIDALVDGVTGEIGRCTVDEERALCPLESRNVDLLLGAITGDGAETVRGQLAGLITDLFLTEYGGCDRPAGAMSSAVRECASKIADYAEKKSDELEQCFFSCERANLRDPEACVDENTGEVISDDVAACVQKKIDDLDDIATRCDGAEVLALGCPLGTETVADLISTLATRLSTFARELNRETFHSSCRTNITGPPPELVPAQVTLEPSMTVKQVSCGQVLDDAFFGSDRVLNLDSNLDCGPVTEATNGIVIARSGARVTGRSQTYSIIGPSSRSLRTGTGILIAPGVRRVAIVGFKKIQYFGVGIQDSGDSKRLRVKNTTLFRNTQAGVRTTAPGVKLSGVVADRNGMGFDVAGDDTTIRSSSVRGSQPQSASAEETPSSGIGLRLTATDANGNGRAAVVKSSTFEANQIGATIDGTSNLLEQCSVRANLTDGIQVAGSENVLDGNSVKLQVAGHGIVVSGAGNTIESNGADENAGSGFVVSGTANLLAGNGSGSPRGHGNAQFGYVIIGEGNRLDSNRAEANLAGGFLIQATTAQLESNRAQGNAGIGFDVESAANVIDGNNASTSGAAEFEIAPGNVDSGGNRANGRGFSFGTEGATIE